ncbi:MAG: TIGR01906 family membrane protein [bacterium]|nr:TIGR01906 family membrane protein [bacterium]
MTEAAAFPHAVAAPALPARLIGLYLTISFPILAVLVAVRLVMTPLFLQIEYNRPGFPVDAYGFTTADRLRYGPYALDYLLNAEGIEYLGDLTFPDGTSMYNVRELRHMRDVKTVTQAAFAVALIGGALALIGAFVLWRSPATRRPLWLALRAGALFNLVLIAAIVVVVVGNWNFFFTAFHQVFFAEGTWIFLYSDTLIRLFPEQFWFDAAITIGSLTVLAALVTLAIAQRSLMRLPPP